MDFVLIPLKVPSPFEPHPSTTPSKLTSKQVNFSWQLHRVLLVVHTKSTMHPPRLPDPSEGHFRPPMPIALTSLDSLESYIIILLSYKVSCAVALEEEARSAAQDRRRPSTSTGRSFFLQDSNMLRNVKQQLVDTSNRSVVGGQRCNQQLTHIYPSEMGSVKLGHRRMTISHLCWEGESWR